MNKEKELEMKYYSKDLNIAYNDGIQKGRQIERDEIRKKIEIWNKTYFINPSDKSFQQRLNEKNMRNYINELLNSLGEKDEKTN